MNPLLDLLHSLRPAFTEPSFLRFLVLFSGWVQARDSHAVTTALVESGVSGLAHHAAFHRFFSRARWSTDHLGRLLLLRLLQVAPGLLQLLLDDTLCTHKGPRVFGLGSHLDPVRSTRAFKCFAFGHVWVVLSVLVRVPFAERPWAVPLLFRLYRTERDCHAKGVAHRKKTELARELVDLVLSWVKDRELSLCADQAYANDTVLRGLPGRVTFYGAMRDDAVLTRERKVKTRSKKSGRLLRRDVAVPKPHQLATDPKLPWQQVRAWLYGEERMVQFKEVVARWYRGAGKRELKIVIVKTTSGHLPYRVFFCTDPLRSAKEVIETYACRWAIEVLFRDLKQLMGFSASRARSKQAVLRTAPFVGLSYTVLVLWYLEVAKSLPQLGLPVRPWYRKRTVSFADVLRLAQRELDGLDWSDPGRTLANLRERRQTSPPHARAA